MYNTELDSQDPTNAEPNERRVALTMWVSSFLQNIHPKTLSLDSDSCCIGAISSVLHTYADTSLILN